MAMLVALLLVSCSGGSGDEAPAAESVTDLGGGVDTSNSWQVVESQAGVEVSIVEVAPDWVEGELPTDVERAGHPVRIELVDGTMPTEGILLRRTLSTPVPAGQTASLGYLDNRSGTWVPVPTTLSRDRTVLTARVHHFSIWDDLYHQIGTVAGTRFDPPTCDGPIPVWAEQVDFFDEDHSPLRWCAGSDPNDPKVLVVKVAANRAYGYTVRPNADHAWVWSSAATDAGLSDLFTWGLTAAVQLPAVVANLSTASH